VTGHADLCCSLLNGLNGCRRHPSKHGPACRRSEISRLV
jgi:hypothetical protein